jgi:hypothetical protein
VAGRIKSLKNSSDTFGNRTRDLRAGSTVPQPDSTVAGKLLKDKPYSVNLP